jgi:prohibitin 2
MRTAQLCVSTTDLEL